MPEFIKRKKGYAEAQTLNIVSESPNAVEPKCNHFYICSKIQNLSYKEQLIEKGNQVEDAFQRLGGFKEFKLKKSY